MAYCALTDLTKVVPESELIEVTDDGGAGVVDTDVVAAAIAAGDGRIDAYCGVRYTVPFTAPVAEIVKRWSICLTLWELYTRREHVGSREYRRSVEDRYEATMQELGWVKDGTLSIPGVSAASGGAIQVEGPDQDFDDNERSKYDDCYD